MHEKTKELIDALLGAIQAVFENDDVFNVEEPRAYSPKI